MESETIRFIVLLTGLLVFVLLPLIVAGSALQYGGFVHVHP